MTVVVRSITFISRLVKKLQQLNGQLSGRKVSENGKVVAVVKFGRVEKTIDAQWVVVNAKCLTQLNLLTSGQLKKRLLKRFKV